MNYSICFGAYPGKDVFYHLEKVHEHGFGGLEYYNWPSLDVSKTAQAIEKWDAPIVAVCTTFFNLVDLSKQEEYLTALEDTIDLCKSLHVRSIVTQTGQDMQGVSRRIQRENMVETLKRSAELVQKEDLILEVEPLNELDHPGHFLQRSDAAAQVIDQVDSEHIKLVFDIYHQQITEGDVTRNATKYIDHINHFHIADNPGRNEPGSGELNYKHILKAIKDTGFDGFVALECGYTKSTDEAFEEFKKNVMV